MDITDVLVEIGIFLALFAVIAGLIRWVFPSVAKMNPPIFYTFWIVLAWIIIYELYLIEIPASTLQAYKIGKICNALGLSYVCGIIIYYITSHLSFLNRKNQIIPIIKDLKRDISLTKIRFYYDFFKRENSENQELSNNNLSLEEWQALITSRLDLPWRRSLFLSWIHQTVVETKTAVHHLLVYKDEYPEICAKASEIARTRLILHYDTLEVLKYEYYDDSPSELTREPRNRQLAELLHDFYEKVHELDKLEVS